MTLSDAAAWWGAGVATLVLVWDLYKWRRSGPQLEVSASPNMESYGGATADGAGPFVVLEVRNNGARKTTLTHCVGFCHESWLHKVFRRKPKHSFIVANPEPGRIPHVLEAGERWMGLVSQNEQLASWSQNGYLHLGVYHSGSKRAVTCCIVITTDPVTD
jgi:hypothetical protein